MKIARLSKLLLLLCLNGIACRQTPAPAITPPVAAIAASSHDPKAQASNKPLFREVAAEVGLKFMHTSGATGAYYFPETAGGGVALLDYDNDGDLDILCVQSGFLDTSKPASAALVPLPGDAKKGCRLFRNDFKETGKLHFTDVTETSGIHYAGYGMGVAVGDYDNDGFPDLYITGFGHNALYHNEKNGTFRDVTQASNTDDDRWSTSAAFVDYDNDGRLDLVVVNYVDYTTKENKLCYSEAGENDYCGPNSFIGLPTRLFRNLGNGKFQDVTLESGIGAANGAGLGVSCADFNADGRIDIFIANDGAANHLWKNRGNGKFEEAGLAQGVALSDQGYPQANMGVAVGDYDNDGSEDIFISHLMTEGGILYHNEAGHGFLDATAKVGLLLPTRLFTGFGTEWFDYDNDGWLDLFLTNGSVKRLPSQHDKPYPFYQTDQLFHNEDEGKRFRETTAEAGAAFQLPAIGRGAAFGDLDNDGAVDIVGMDNNGPVRVYHNEAAAGNHWISVRLEGTKSNRMGLGAMVTVLRKGQKPLSRRCHTDGSYCAASDSRVHFGLGKDGAIDAVEVRWTDGAKERWNAPKSDGDLSLKQGTGLK